MLLALRLRMHQLSQEIQERKKRTAPFSLTFMRTGASRAAAGGASGQWVGSVAVDVGGV